MKLILTENQYKLLEAIINEAAIPFSTKMEEGGSIEIVSVLNDVETRDTIKLTKKYKGGQYFEGTGANGTYIINVGGAFDKDNNTFTIRKDGKYIEAGVDANGKPTNGELVGGVNQTYENVTEVNITDSNNTIVDRIQTALGVEKIKTTRQKERVKQEPEVDSAEKDKRRLKKIIKMIDDDPNLKKLYHHQPSILGGLIKLGKARGLSYISTLLNKHNFGDSGKIKKEFLNNKVYQYEVAYPVTVSNGKQSIKFLTGQVYQARFEDNKFKSHVGTASDKIDFYIELGKKSDVNTYIGTVTANFKKPKLGDTPERIEPITNRIVVIFRK